MSAQLGWITVRVHSRTPHLPRCLRTFGKISNHRDVTRFSPSARFSKSGLKFPVATGRNWATDADSGCAGAVEMGVEVLQWPL